MKRLQLKKHVLTGIAYMMPVVVAGDICLGISRILRGMDIQEGTIAAALEQIRNVATGFTVPVIATGIAYSTANRPGIVPGLVASTLANVAGARFLEGLAGDFIADYFAWLAKTYIRSPKLVEGLMPVLVTPALSTLAVGLVFMYLISTPLAMVQQGMTDWPLSLQGESDFLMGAIIGGVRFNMGGPFAQTADAFCDAILTQGVYTPKVASTVNGMTPSVGVTIAVFLARKRFTRAEREATKATLPLGLCSITEDVFLFLMSDPLRVIAACTTGSAISSGLTVIFGCLCPIPAGGVFAVPFITEPFLFVIAFLTGVTVAAGVLLLLEPNRGAVAEDTEKGYDPTVKFNTEQEGE